MNSILPGGREVELIEVEVITAWEGSQYLGREVPYIVPVNYQDGTEELSPYGVELYMVKK